MRPGRPIAAAGIVLAMLLTGSSTAQQAPATDCLGRDATIQGSGAIVGTPGRDVIVGSAGPDVIRGGGSADIICGAFGKDRIVGGEGPDVISGGAGRDLVIGDGATWTDKRAIGGDGDTIYGNGAADVLVGDSYSSRGTAVNRGGRDYIVGNDGRQRGKLVPGDLLIGGSLTRAGRVAGQDGRDEMKGVNGPDLMIGDNATLRSGPRPVGQGTRDNISGGLADDHLVGGDGEDTCFGRGGMDSFTACETKTPTCPRGAFDGVRERQLIGLPLDEARELGREKDGCVIRVLERDGRPLAGSDDRRTDRINVAVRDGRIIRVIGFF